MGRGEVCKWYWWGSVREKVHLEEPALEVEMILKWIIRKRFGGMYWFEEVPGRDRLWDLANAVMNLMVP
jgi:hypothetical protein